MPELKLRGLCSFLDVDSYFTMITSGLKNRRYHMQGWTHSNIEWEDREEEWQIRSVKHSGVIASCNDTTDYPLGTHRWYFKDQLCSEEGQSYRLLNIHSCQDGEIPCRNGDCIAVESRFSTNVIRLAVHNPHESGATDAEIASTIRTNSIVRLSRFLTAISEAPHLLH